MILTVFASGSSGNCTLVSEGDTHLLIDDGISFRRLSQALSRRGLTPGELSGVLITHEHNDHISGIPMLSKHCGRPLFAPCASALIMSRGDAGVEAYMHRIEQDAEFSLGAFRIRAFPTPHDAVCSVGYRLESASGTLGYCTDCGSLTEEVLAGLSGCDAVVIEANHDEEMLRFGPYPVYLKRRILSERGHLSNENCGALAVSLAETGCSGFTLAHLSRENNRPELAYQAVRSALDGAGYPQRELTVAPVFGELCVEVSRPCCV